MENQIMITKEYYIDLIKWLEKEIPLQETYSERVEIRKLITETRKKLNELEDE